MIKQIQCKETALKSAGQENGQFAIDTTMAMECEPSTTENNTSWSSERVNPRPRRLSHTAKLSIYIEFLK